MSDKKADQSILWFLIVFFLGLLGVDKFLRGKMLWGLIKLFSFGFFAIGNFIEAFMVLAGKYEADPTKYFK